MELLPLPPLPPEAMMFMGDKPDSFLARGENLLAVSNSHASIGRRPVIDIGCGYGRLAYALANRGFSGRYYGVDVLKKHIDWLNKNFSPSLPNFHFEHINVLNGRYNSSGKVDPAKFRIPHQYHKPDLVLVLSVFTHMFEADVESYLHAIAKVLDDHSTVYATFFILSDEQRELERSGASLYPMTHQINDHCRYFNQQDPLHAISFDEAFLHSMFERCGLHAEYVIRGGWCGREDAGSFQDAVFLKRRR
jgi:SAM-dependent methyltransferase